MIQVEVDTIRVRLPGHERLILLKETEGDRRLPIYIGVHEAEAIILELKGYQPQRPLTHDLLLSAIEVLGGRLDYVLVSELKDEVFHGRLHVVQDGREIDIDARSSDSVALAVRAKVPIYVSEEVMEQAAMWPAEEVEESKEKLSAFRKFVNSLNLDDL